MDECLFISTESIDPAGAPPIDDFHVMRWDPEDLQQACPSIGLGQKNSELTYCVLNSFYRPIILHPEIFKDYVRVLKTVMSDIPPPKEVQTMLDQACEEIFPLIKSY